MKVTPLGHNWGSLDKYRITQNPKGHCSYQRPTCAVFRFPILQNASSVFLLSHFLAVTNCSVVSLSVWLSLWIYASLLQSLIFLPCADAPWFYQFHCVVFRCFKEELAPWVELSVDLPSPTAFTCKHGVIREHEELVRSSRSGAARAQPDPACPFSN